MKRLPLALAAGLLLGTLPAAFAGKVKTWHHHRPGDHDKAQLSGVVVGSEGTLRLSRELTPLAKLDAAHAWAVVEDRAGRLYVATGDEGHIYRVQDGKATVFHTVEASQILSLAIDPNGQSVYAGTGPEATVVRIYENAAKNLCTLPESYVWALATSPTGDAIYAATGPNGRIYRITPDGKASVFFETKQDHVLCLAVATDGSVYAGTDKTGRVYRISPQGKGFVVYQAAQTEVKTLLVAGDVIYAGTSAMKTRRASARDSDSASKSTAKLESGDTPVRAVSRGDKVAAATERSSSKSKEPTKGTAAPAPDGPASGENSVYRIAPDGGVREVFRSKVLVLSLAKRGDRLLVATGMKGELFEVDETTREKTAIARLDHGQLTSLCQRRDGSLVVAAGDPGKLYALTEKFVTTGSVTSEVLDAKISSRWGAMTWREDVPAKSRVTVATRSGNVAEPDDTWSDWTDEETDGSEASIKSPAARYLQYRVTLTADDVRHSPSLKSLTLRYANANQPPELTKLEVPDLTSGESGKKLKFKWAATDANEDELRYSLYVQKDGWKEWVQLENDLDKTEYEWDATTTPSGIYRLKLVASDHTDNSEKNTLICDKISEPFVVCHTPPAVTVKAKGLEDGRMSIEASAKSPLARLTSASYAVNGKKWVGVLPEDGIFDGKSEAFAFRTDALKPGAYVLVLKVQDAAGNTGSADVVFTVPAKEG